MTKELKLAAAQFPAFTWNTGIAEDLRADLLEIQLGKQLAALGGQLVQRDGQLKVVSASNDLLDLYDGNDPKPVTVESLIERVQAGASFKALTEEGRPKPVQPQPDEMPAPTTTNPAMLNASRAARDAVADFQRGQQETEEFAQRMAQSFGQPAPVFTGKYESGNRATQSYRRASEESLADFQRGQQ